MTEVVITGLGVVSPIGSSWSRFSEGLRAGRCGVGPISRFDASGYRSQVGGEVRCDLGDVFGTAAQTAGLSFPSSYGRTAVMALAAVSEALCQAGLHREDCADDDTGVSLGGSTAGTPESEVGHLDGPGGEDFWSVVPPSKFLLMPVGSTADVLAAALGTRGPVSTISTACSSATNALGQALRWIRAGRCSRVVAGGSDALCRLTHAGFNSLNLVDPERPRPFDARRRGMCIGEGAAFFVVESGDRARARGARILGRLLGFGNIAEAHHLVQPQPDGSGAVRSMRMALDDAGLRPEAVDYLNAHGTGTLHNDRAEATAIHRLFGPRATSLPVSSTKSQTGHLLGASGAVELAAALIGCREGFLPPTSGWEVADADIDLDVVPGQAREGSYGVFLSNSFAFGGNDATLCVSGG